jgi:anti-sigma regulatory factor (Ser/Thr protein kinase)
MRGARISGPASGPGAVQALAQAAVQVYATNILPDMSTRPRSQAATKSCYKRSSRAIVDVLMPAPFGLQTTGNRLSITGLLGTRDFRRLLAAMHNLTSGQGYQDLELDFTGCTAAYGGPILAIAAQTKRYLIGGLDVDLMLPKDERLNRLFLNANWANLIDPRRYDPGNYRGYAQIPVMQFRTGQDQHEAVTLATDKILSTLTKFDRNHLKAIEWSLNELTDNVINHAQSPVGGLLQITNFVREQKIVEFCVCDAGIGIPASLRGGHNEIRSDQEALDKAIREGVTRDKRVGQGNGLYGS